MIKRIFPVLGISIFASMLGIGIIAPLLPLYAEDLGATGIWIGIIFASFSISRAIFIPIVGRLSDQNGRKVFICSGLFSYAVISLGYVWASSTAELTIIRLLHGAAGGMIIPIAQAYIGDLSPEGEEGRWMGYFNTAFFAGFGFGPLLGGVLTDTFDMASAFYTMGILNLIAFLLALRFLPETRQKGNKATSPKSSFRNMATSGVLQGLFSYRLFYALGRGAFTCFLPIFAASFLGLSPSQIGIVLAFNILLMSLFQAFSGVLADRCNRKGLVIAGGLINFLFLALITQAQSFWQLLALAILGSTGGALSMPAASAMTIEEGRRYGMGSAIAVFTMAMSLGMAAGPILGGVVADLLNVKTVFYMGAGVGLVGTGLFAWLTNKRS